MAVPRLAEEEGGDEGVPAGEGGVKHEDQVIVREDEVVRVQEGAVSAEGVREVLG